VSQVVEQQRVGGKIASGTEVIDRAHQALAEQVHPDAVDDDAGGERVLRMGDPLGKLEATALVGGDAGSVRDFGGLNEATGDGGAEIADVAANMNGAIGGLRVIEHAHRLRALRTGFLQAFDFLIESGLLGERCGEGR
jgi:hypothetical protein